MPDGSVFEDRTQMAAALGVAADRAQISEGLPPELIASSVQP